LFLLSTFVLPVFRKGGRAFSRTRVFVIAGDVPTSEPSPASSYSHVNATLSFDVFSFREYAFISETALTFRQRTLKCLSGFENPVVSVHSLVFFSTGRGRMHARASDGTSRCREELGDIAPL